MKKVLRLLLMLLLFLAAVFLFSFLVDPANVFYARYDQTVAEILASGHSAEGVENMDDRRFLTLYANLRTQPIDTLVLGSSRAMQITPAVTGDPNTFVAGVTGSDLRDCISAYELFAQKGFAPKTVVLSLDFWYLSAGNLDSRAMTDGYEQFCRDNGLAPLESGSAKLSRIKNFFSFSYFQSSVEYLARGKHKTLPTPTDAAFSVKALRRPDGSYGYEQALRDRTQAEIDQSASDKQIADNIAAGFTGIDQGLCDQLETFVRTLTAQGIHVKLLLSPVHPIYYAYMQAHPDTYSVVFDTERFCRALAARTGAAVCGSYDPSALGVTGSDFYDEVHPRTEALQKYYDLALTQEATNG